MDPNKEQPPQPKGFEALLHQNEIADAKEKADKKIESLEERIRKQAPQKTSSVVRNIRTLKGDVEESIAMGKTTMVGIASSEARARSLRDGVNVVISAVTSEKTKKISLYTVGFALIAIGLAGLYYIYTIRQEPGTIEVEKESSLVSVEKIKKIDISGLSAEKLRELLREETTNADEDLGTMVGIVLTKKTTDPNGKTTTQPITTQEFFTALNLNPPSRLSRALEPEFLFGVHIFDNNQAFLIFKTNSYENAFAGMLSWEDMVGRTVGSVLRSPADFIRPGTTTAIFDKQPFSDVIFRNIDIRALKNSEDKNLIVYSFPARDTLIITTHVQTVSEVFNRLTSRRIVR